LHAAPMTAGPDQRKSKEREAEVQKGRAASGSTVAREGLGHSEAQRAGPAAFNPHHPCQLPQGGRVPPHPH
jgi:hypothetical protein